jgi:hypothetical protein
MSTTYPEKKIFDPTLLFKLLIDFNTPAFTEYHKRSLLHDDKKRKKKLFNFQQQTQFWLANNLHRILII